MSAYLPNSTPTLVVSSANTGGVKKKHTKKRRNMGHYDDDDGDYFNRDDVMILEHHAPAPINGSSAPAKLAPPSSPKKAASPNRSTSSQFSSSQSIYLTQSPPDQASTTPPPQPKEVTRADLEKQLQDALQRQQTQQPDGTPKNSKKRFYDSRAPSSVQFSWDVYLDICPAEPAPKEAFRQPKTYPQNMFVPGMKLEVKDPRNATNWCLANVIVVEGLHLRLRLIGTDGCNDIHELIDSENIAPFNTHTLYAPTGYTGNLAQYPKLVDKIQNDESTIFAPDNIFPSKPEMPPANLFKVGMKLEAVDRKNKDFICPATIGGIDGKFVKIVFDGWRGSFDYECEYFSRDLFPINWCRDTGRSIQPPNGWLAILQRGPAPKEAQPLNPTPRPDKLSKVVTPAKKKRGRKPKEAKEPKSKVISSTLKKKKSKPSTTEDHTYSSKVEEEIDSSSDDDEGPVADPFQCQRAVSYHEWKKNKSNSSQMPRGDSASLSDTISTTSTMPVSRGSEIRVTKRPKRDDSSGPSDESASERIDLVLASKPKKLRKWSVDDVIELIKTEDTLIKYVPVFQENEIDGRAFILFDKKDLDLLMQMGLKMGPVLKMLDLRERVAPHLDLS